MWSCMLPPWVTVCLSPHFVQLARDNFFHCGVLYEDSLSSQIRTRLELEEDVKIYLEENYERINVPVPQFGGGDPADIIHDFQRVRLPCSIQSVAGWDLEQGSRECSGDSEQGARTQRILGLCINCTAGLFGHLDWPSDTAFLMKAALFVTVKDSVG